MYETLDIINPKRRPTSSIGRDTWFPYYAGFSGDFARKVVDTCAMDSHAQFLDPWNGSGTTTSAAAQFGYRSFGFDLNPAMVVAAKARLLSNAEAPSIEPLLADIVKKAISNKRPSDQNDPLLRWFAPVSSSRIRSLDRAIFALLISAESEEQTAKSVTEISPIAAFFLVGLFRAVRSALTEFVCSNPTWIGRPKTLANRLRPSRDTIHSLFRQNIREMSTILEAESETLDYSKGHSTISVASSEKLPLADNSVDFVLSSPPYCTRIDYGVATLPELAVLGFGAQDEFSILRNKLIGTPTIHESQPPVDSRWGNTCSLFLERLHKHPSKAAQTYYYKTYVQYFRGIFDSFKEIARCITPRGKCVIVVQNSNFKDIKVDLVAIFREIATDANFVLARQVDFHTRRSFVSINTNSRKYGQRIFAEESVLCFTKN